MDNELTVKTALFSYRKAKLSLMSKLHSHEVFEIYYLLSGRRRYFIDHRTFDLEAGDIILIPPYTLHQSLKIPHTPSNDYHERYLLCPEVGHIPEELTACFSKNLYHLSAEDSAFVRFELEAIKHEVERDDAYSFSMYRSSLFKILTLLSRNYLLECLPQTVSKRRIDRIIENVQEYVKYNADRELTLSAVADKFGLTQSYLSFAFKSSTGLGFSEYLTKTRIAKSIKLLAKNDIPISEIAEKCGFNNGNYFATVFKKAMGVTPTEYRSRTNPLL